LFWRTGDSALKSITDDYLPGAVGGQAVGYGRAESYGQAEGYGECPEQNDVAPIAHRPILQ
jgi:hypothetical protein